MSSAYPFVSVLTPTYNRRAFIPTAIECFKAQTYPMNRMEWIILDDGTDPVGDLFAASGLTNVRYIRITTGKMTIGAKRNQLTDLATGEICVCWDDDDYYVPDRVKKAVHKLRSFKGGAVPIVGASQSYLYYPSLDQIYSFGPFMKNHCTNGTMAYWTSYAKANRYDDNAEKAEERMFTREWKTPVAQLEPQDVMLVICHNRNTVDKRGVLDRGGPTLRKLSVKIKSIVKSAAIREFYASLVDDIPLEDEELPTITVTELPQQQEPVPLPAMQLADQSHPDPALLQTAPH